LAQAGVPVASRAARIGAPTAVARARQLVDAIAEQGTFSLPWAALVTTAAALALAGVLGLYGGLGALVLPAATVGPGGIARALFATDAIALPALLLLSIGGLTGLHTRPWTVLTALSGAGLLAALSATGSWLAGWASYDPNVVRAVSAGGVAAAALITGFVVSAVRRKMAFVELFLVALIVSYAIYLAVAVGPKELIAASNVPEEQVLLALVLAPALGLLALLAVGGSVGFLLLGGGALDPGFRYEARVALRYLRASRRDRFVGKVTIISVLGVCLGVMALIVVLSVMSGFEDDLKQKILGAHAHIVLGKHGDDFVEYTDVEERVRGVEGVKTAAAFILGDAMISSDVGLSGTLVKGIHAADPKATAELRANIEKGSLEHVVDPSLIPGARPRVTYRSSTSTAAGARTSTTGVAEPYELAEPILRGPAEGGRVLPGIIIGRELSKTLRAYVGDTVKLVSPVSDEIGPTGPHPKLRRFRVAGIFYSGMYEYDAKFTYVDMKQAQSFFGKRGKVTGIELMVDDVDDTSRISEDLKRVVGGWPYTVRDWRDMNKELFSALLLEKLAMFIILTFIILVASFNIVATLVMIVLEKGKEIAILKSLGASDASIMKIFVVQGLIVGVGGALLGLTGGIGICAFIERYGIRLDQKVFYIERLPVVMSWGEISAIAIAAVMISYLATIYPAMTAARLRPVEGLRDE
ncbi:ABC transporter permease, partial [Myxococcota bacterium]|nr:ABC transporter permease [Myxococcota bacterium]